MRYVNFGSTGLRVSEVGFGGIPIIRLGQAEAVEVLAKAYDRGITFYDTANAYRDSEQKMGIAFKGRRDKIVIATKTLRRDGPKALEHLENSLRMLGTDYIDIYQLHQIAQDRDWEAASAPGGAYEVAVKARDEGKIRFISVTSHNLPMAVKLTRMGLFSSIQVPFNFIETAAKDELRTAALEQGMGILAMKPFAGGMIDNARLAFKYLRQYPEILPIPGFDSAASVDEIVSFYDTPNSVATEDLQAMDRYRDELGKEFCRRCEYCQPCPEGVMITPAMAYKVIASRMSPGVAVEFARAAMDSVLKCTECGICRERCPYELPVEEMLKANYDLYESHRGLAPEATSK